VTSLPKAAINDEFKAFPTTVNAAFGIPNCWCVLPNSGAHFSGL